jgi:uncharacterized membrane protein YjgN (DUF898 family)
MSKQSIQWSKLPEIVIGKVDYGWLWRHAGDAIFAALAIVAATVNTLYHVAQAQPEPLVISELPALIAVVFPWLIALLLL